MRQIAIQLRAEDASSCTLNGGSIAFIPVDSGHPVFEAVINEHLYERIKDALGKIPYKIDENFKIDKNGTTISYKAVNGANW